MLSLPNINLPNVNKKMKPRWLRPFPITQVNKQGNNYTIDLSSNSDLRQVYTTFHIELLKPYRENKDNEFQQRDYSKPGPVKDHRYEVEEAVDFSFRHPTREDLYQITWKRYLPSHDQQVHSNEIDEEVEVRFWQEEGLKPTVQRRRYHRGRTEPRKRRETLSEIQVERDQVMQSIMITSVLRFEEPAADQ